MSRLDIYDDLPEGMRRYLSQNGWHFNKAMFEWACSRMKDRNGAQHQTVDKQKVDEILKTAGIQLKNNVLYDAAYIYNMKMSDCFGSSIKDTNTAALSVRDYLDDIDGTPTRALDEFYGRSIGAGVPIPWDELI